MGQPGFRFWFLVNKAEEVAPDYGAIDDFGRGIPLLCLEASSARHMGSVRQETAPGLDLLEAQAHVGRVRRNHPEPLGGNHLGADCPSVRDP